MPADPWSQTAMHWSLVQTALKSTLDEMGRGDAAPLGERILFRDRCLVGISFDFEGISAIWLTAIGQLKFVDDSGALLKVLSLLDGEPTGVSKAA
jgi:hypothetical protein